MFVRGGVYRVVKEAMGGTLAKLSVSALLFDYILTGPTSGVSAGQYVIGWWVDFFHLGPDSFLSSNQNLLAAGIAVAITVYFWRVNLKGIHESSDQALRIMGATTVMGIIMILWCGATLVAQPEKLKAPPITPNFDRKIDPVTHEPMLDPQGKQVDPLGFLGHTAIGESLRSDHMKGNWFSLLGVVGLLIAFGHSILAMSGEETLAQVYREVESPKLKNFKRAAFVVFVYSMLFTSLISFFAVMIIPDDLRVTKYSGNLIGGLAMNVIGPRWALLGLNAVVVFVGFLILSGAVNTAIVGSNGVLNRISEDGVLPDWFLKPHLKFGTTYRLINTVAGLQIFTIIASRGNVLTLGEAYAFGVVWSFVFKALSMLVLRFKQPGHREYEVPFNFRAGKFDVPLGISLIFLVLAGVAVVNFMTKEVATITGSLFTGILFSIFFYSERAHQKRRGSVEHHEHLEQFNEAFSERITPQGLSLTKPYRKLVAIRSPYNLGMLEKCLNETDPETTEVVVMTATVLPPASADYEPTISDMDRHLLTAVVTLAEHAGKPVRPLIVPTNQPFYALAQTAKTIGAQELIMGPSNKFRPEDQLDAVALYWFNVCGAAPDPLSIRVLGKDRDMRLDIAGGSQIPKPGAAAAESARLLADLRKSWHGVEKLLLAYDGSPLSADFLDTVMSFLDPAIAVTLIDVAEADPDAEGPADPVAEANDVIMRGVERARELGRNVTYTLARGQAGQEIVRAAIDGQFDAIFMSLRGVYRRGDTTAFASNTRYVLENAPCRVILGFAPKSIPAPGTGNGNARTV